MKLTVYVDRINSWYTPYAQTLTEALVAGGHDAVLVHKVKEVQAGDACFLLSCVRIAKQALLEKNRSNFVIHASALPTGRGFSPLAYQISSGGKEVPLTMIEVAEAVDAGDIIMEGSVLYEGHELIEELREKLAGCIQKMVLDYVAQPSLYAAKPQVGEPTWYPRRTAQDDQLDPHQTIASQFNKLRVVDNEAYPAWFEYLGHRYTLTIEKQKS